MGSSSKRGGRKGRVPASSRRPTRLHSILKDVCSLLTAETTGSKSSIRMENFSINGKQFGQASGIFIDKNDFIYVADNESNSTRNPGFKRGIRIGSAKDGSVTAFIPDPEPDPDHTDSGAAEGVGADASGNIYGSEVVRKTVMKYVRK